MPDQVRSDPIRIVAVGGSAGGLSALTRFFDGVPPDSRVAYVAILHLSPDRDSQLSEILDRRASIPVVEVTESVEIEPDRAYVISPRSQLEISGSRLKVMELPPGRPRMPVDRFFRSLADERGGKAAGVVLSGTGRDGALGLRAIREKGGITAAQDPEDADYAEMPRSAISEGRAEIVLPADELAKEVLRIIGEDGLERTETATLSDRAESALDRIIELIGSESGHDLGRFRRSTFLRRLDRRMRFEQIGSIEEYARYIEVDREERRALFQDLLISVSHFFRDPDAFEFLERHVIPKLFEGKGREDQVRVWVPGCATGEEAYSLAMLLHEQAAALDPRPEIQIFATDIDESALSFARRAHYPESIADDLSAARLERYFDQDDAGYRVVKPLRDTVLFAIHGVLKDPPFSHLDLVSCRNLLIYLEPGAQDEVVERFHYALRPDGYLFLGASETVGPDFFQPVAKNERIFQRAEGAGSIPLNKRRREDLRPVGGLEVSEKVVREADRGSEPSSADVHGRLLRMYGPASVVVNAAGEIVHSSESAGRYLRHPGGEPTKALLDVARDGLVDTLRTALYRAFENQKASRRSVELEIEGEDRIVEVVVRPSAAEDLEPYALILFDESPGVPDPDPTSDDQTVSELKEELEDTREQLQTTIEEREATIEELQAANEELQSLNEEHQATAEELETRREELQSVNEELTTINQEHRITIGELGELNADLRNLMESTEIATIFLDEDLCLRRYTESATDLFNMLPGDEGRPFSHITHHLDLEESLVDLIREVIDTRSTREREVWDEEGHNCYVMGIHPYTSREEGLDGAVLTLFEITDQKRMERDIRQATLEAEAERRRLLALMDHLPAGVVLVDADSRKILSANQRARRILWTSDDPGGEFRWDQDREARRLPEDGRWPIGRAIDSGEAVLEEEVSVDLEDGGRRHLLVNAAPIEDENGRVRECVLAMVDIEEVLRHARAKEAERTRERVMATVSTVSHEFRTPVNAILGYTQLLTEGIPEPLPQSQRRNAERIQACTRHLDFMVEQILVYSQLEEGEQTLVSEEVDPTELARDATSILEREARQKDLSIRVETEGEVGPFTTDPDKLRQVLVNLVQNAVKFTEEGEVVVTVSKGEDVSFEVRDTGVGIAPEDQKRIFERFGKARRQHQSGVQSTGLGLAIVKDLTRRLGGEIELESEPGRGSVFRVSLPRAQVEDPDVGPPDPAALRAEG